MYGKLYYPLYLQIPESFMPFNNLNKMLKVIMNKIPLILGCNPTLRKQYDR